MNIISGNDEETIILDLSLYEGKLLKEAVGRTIEWDTLCLCDEDSDVWGEHEQQREMFNLRRMETIKAQCDDASEIEDRCRIETQASMLESYQYVVSCAASLVVCDSPAMGMRRDMQLLPEDSSWRKKWDGLLYMESVLEARNQASSKQLHE